MNLLKISLASAIAYGLYRYVTSGRKADRSPSPAAFAPGESSAGVVDVRNAGPKAMASKSPKWDSVDEASDESYPSSDAPSTNRFT